MLLILFTLFAVVYIKILDLYVHVVHHHVLIAQSTVLNIDALPA